MFLAVGRRAVLEVGPVGHRETVHATAEPGEEEDGVNDDDLFVSLSRSFLLLHLVSPQLFISMHPCAKGPSAAKNPSGQHPNVVLSQGSTGSGLHRRSNPDKSSGPSSSEKLHTRQLSSPTLNQREKNERKEKERKRKKERKGKKERERKKEKERKRERKKEKERRGLNTSLREEQQCKISLKFEQLLINKRKATMA